MLKESSVSLGRYQLAVLRLCMFYCDHLSLERGIKISTLLMQQQGKQLIKIFNLAITFFIYFLLMSSRQFLFLIFRSKVSRYSFVICYGSLTSTLSNNLFYTMLSQHTQMSHKLLEFLITAFTWWSFHTVIDILHYTGNCVLVHAQQKIFKTSLY